MKMIRVLLKERVEELYSSYIQCSYFDLKCCMNMNRSKTVCGLCCLQAYV